MSEPLHSPSGAASPSGAGVAAAASPSPSPSSAFSPSSFLSGKLADARAAVSAINNGGGGGGGDAGESSSASSGGNAMLASLEGLASPVRAQVDAALGRAQAELRAKLSAAEEELRARAARMDADLSAARADIEQQARAKFTAAEEELRARAARVDADLTAARADMERQIASQRAELEAKVEARTGEVRARLAAELQEQKAAWEAKKLALHGAALAQFEKMLLGLLDDKVLPAVQEAAVDPLMPGWVARVVRNSVEAAWPDVKEEVIDVWQGATLKFEPIDPGVPPSLCPNIFSAIRASFVYHTFPYDRNIWWQLRRPMWWFWNIVAAFPLYGVQAAYFIFLFLCLDKSDEFQMVQFILQFKGAQFFTLGLLSCVIGATSFYRCVSFDYVEVTLPAPTGLTRLLVHDCANSGPGALPGFYTDMILFGIQGLTIWTAMALLPSTRKKGLRKTAPGSPPRRFHRHHGGGGAANPGAGDDDEADAVAEVERGGGCCARGKPVYGGMGGKLRWMIFFDAWVLLFLVSVGVLLLFIRPYDILADDGSFAQFEWLFKQDLFFLKTAYGLLSFPFLVFLVPLLSQLLLHTRATGYNRAGECVPVLSRPNEPALATPEEAVAAAAGAGAGASGTSNGRSGGSGGSGGGAQQRNGVKNAWSDDGAGDHAIEVRPAA
jgi:hypothetical protein